MTDPKALIAEARELLTCDGLGEHFPYAFSLITRLAAALEEATVPEGWRVTEYRYSDDSFVWQGTQGEWWGKGGMPGHKRQGPFPTAREAMAALDGPGEL